jgi:hypothetical protein
LFTYSFANVGAAQRTRIDLVATIELKRLSRRATRVSAARSQAVE